MKFTLTCSLVLALGASAGNCSMPVQYTPTNANCVNYTVPVSWSTQGATFVAPKWNDTYGLTDFVSITGSRTNPTMKAPIAPGANLTGSATISGTFCSPKTPNGKTSTVLIATHGIGFSRAYWNAGISPEEYNFVQFAIGKGYSVFFYDRLGTGQSSVGSISGFVNQANNQISILGQIASQIKGGQYTGSIGKPSKVVLVGHSFGSFISHGLLAQQPNAADGAVLTGLAFSVNASTNTEAFNPRVATEQSKKYAGRDTGYITWVDVFANINNFLKAPYYTRDAAAYSEQTKQPWAITEQLSIPSINFNATKFTGPVLVFNGEFDFIVCSGYCPGVNEEPARSYFAGSKAFKALTQPGTGHGLTLHKNATGGYQVITDYLNANGL